MPFEEAFEGVIHPNIIVSSFIVLGKFSLFTKTLHLYTSNPTPL